jgi:hypothetical protein
LFRHGPSSQRGRLADDLLRILRAVIRIDTEAAKKPSSAKEREFRKGVMAAKKKPGKKAKEPEATKPARPMFPRKPRRGKASRNRQARRYLCHYRMCRDQFLSFSGKMPGHRSGLNAHVSTALEIAFRCTVTRERRSRN